MDEIICARREQKSYPDESIRDVSNMYEFAIKHIYSEYIQSSPEQVFILKEKNWILAMRIDKFQSV